MHFLLFLSTNKSSKDLSVCCVLELQHIHSAEEIYLGDISSDEWSDSEEDKYC